MIDQRFQMSAVEIVRAVFDVFPGEKGLQRDRMSFRATGWPARIWQASSAILRAYSWASALPAPTG